VVTPEVHQRVMERVIMPTVRGMAAEGNVYTGFLYAGLMIDAEGNPKVIEFNCRFGDPETQPIMLRMQSDLVDLRLAACAGKLDQVEAVYDPVPPSAWCWRRVAIPATTPATTPSAACRWTKWRGEGVPCRHPLEGDTSLTPVAACCAPPPSATRCRRRSSGPMPWLAASSGTASSTARTSAGVPSSASRPNKGRIPITQGPAGPFLLHSATGRKSSMDDDFQKQTPEKLT
jgi:hypothetical protein